MKLQTKIFLIALIIVGGVLMSNYEGICNGSKYEHYSSQDVELNLTMDYPKGWEYSEQRGSYGSYTQVQFRGEVKNNYAPSIVATVTKETKVKFTPLTVQGMVEDITQKRMLFEDAQVVSRSETQIFGLPAVDMTLMYKQLARPHSLDDSLISYKERVMIIQKDGKFYTLRYMNPESAYDTFEQGFLHCVQTLSIK